MRYAAWLMVVSVLTSFSCHRSNPSSSNGNAVILVTVTQTGNLPEAGKQIALVETRDTLTTDANGRVIFVVPPGTYTVRAFGLNHGGPVQAFLDSTAVVRAGDTTRIACWDCPLCL